MEVVICGGTGPLGRALCASYLKDGHQVTIISRSPDIYRPTFPDQVSLAGWDGKTVGDWATVVDSTDVVFNFAGENIAGEGFIPDRWTVAKKRRIVESRTGPGEALTEAIRQATIKPATFVQASGINYYGIDGDEILSEQSAVGNDYLARVTVEWEAATAGVEAMGVRRAIVRTGLMLATDSGPLPRMVFPFRLFGGGYFGDGDVYYSWIHKNDVTRALRFIAEDERASGPVNLVAPNPVTKRDFSKAIGRATHRPAWFPVPAFLMRLFLGEVSTLVLDGQRAVPQKLIDFGFNYRFPEVDEALEDLL